MIRWPMLVIGIALLVLSLVATAKFPMLPAEPSVLDVQAAAALTQDDSYYHVQVSGAPDLEKKIYPTLSVRPVYGQRTPTKKYDLCPAGQPLPSDLDSYLGTVVRIARPLESRYISMRTELKRTAGEDELLRERLLAPVSDCEGRIWAVSAAFKAGDHDSKRWPNSAVVEGVLTRLSDVNKNMRSYRLEHSWKDTKAFVEKELQTSLTDDGYLVLTDYEWHPPKYYYCPLQDSDNAVFAQLDDARAANAGGSLTGVLETAELRLYQEFADVLGEPVPDRIGIVTMETAKQYNQRRASNAEGMKQAGLVLTGLGVVFVCVRGRRKKWAKMKYAA